MKWILPVVICLSLSLMAYSQAKPDPRGYLVIVGGGGTPDVVLDRALKEAGGKEKANVVIFPQASRRPDAGERNQKMWAGRGAKHIVVADLEKPKAVIAALGKADVIWFSGGSQNRLMDALKKAGVVQEIKNANARGAIVGGTSAGAAVMSAQMMTGGGETSTKAALVNTTELADGLGLAEGTIVDQHFHARRRFNRLLSAVAQNPKRLGLGIDERTAVLWKARRGTFEILGEGSVAVLDGRHSKQRGEKGKPLHAVGFSFHNLVSGDEFEIVGRKLVVKTKKPTQPVKEEAR